jgi:hypothetical protein
MENELFHGKNDFSAVEFRPRKSEKRIAKPHASFYYVNLYNYFL